MKSNPLFSALEKHRGSNYDSNPKGYVSTSSVHLDLGKFSHSSRQILSNSISLDGEHL